MNNCLHIRHAALMVLLFFAVSAQAQFPMNLPTLNPGDSIIVSFDVEIDPNTTVCEVSCQAEVTVGMSTILSDDPDTGTPNDPTVTALADDLAPMAMCNDITVYLPQGDYEYPPADSIAITAGTTDNCGDFTATFNPPFLSCSDVGVTIVTVTYTDASGNMSSCTTNITLIDTIPPAAFCSDVTVYLDSDGLATIDVTDIGSGTDICSIASEEIDITNLNCDDTGSPVVVTLTVTDVNGNSATCTSSVTVLDTISPMISCPGNQIGFADDNCEAPLPNFTDLVTFTDNCNVSLVQSPPSETTISGHGTVQVVTMTATDDSGNTSTCTFQYTLQDTMAPTPVCQDITINLDAAGVASITAASIDGGSFDNCAVSGISIDQSTFTCVDLPSVVVTLTVTDVAGNMATCTATVTINDPLSVCCDLPVAVCQDITVYLNESGIVVLDPLDIDIGSMADCGLQSLSLLPMTLGCDSVGEASVTLIVTDDNGNTGTCTSNVTVLDTIFPEIICPADISTECGPGELPAPNPSIISATDNCANPLVTFVSDVESGTCERVVIRTYMVTDAGGNTATCTQRIFIDDSTAPDLSGCGSLSTTIECNADENLIAAEAWNQDNITTLESCASDACDTDLTGQVTSNFDFANLTDGCGITGSLTVTYTVSDECGNMSTFTATLTIEDGTAPEISQCPSLDLTISCDPATNMAMAAQWNQDNISALENCASDACDTDLAGQVSGNYSFTNLIPNCGLGGFITVNYTISDDCGNTSTFAATLTIEDNTAPDLTGCTLPDVTVECDQLMNEDTLGSWDAANIALLEGCATDLCNSSPLTIFSNLGEVVQLSDGCGTTGTVTVTYIVIDDCNNVATITASFTIEDNTAPDLSQCGPLDGTAECNIESNSGQLSAWNAQNIASLASCATDLCDDMPLTVTSNLDQGAEFAVECGTTGTYLVTYSVTDACDNTATFTATYTIEDTTPPDVSFCEPLDLTIECSAAENEAAAMAWNNGNIADLEGCAFDLCDTDLTGQVTSDFDFANLTDGCGITGSLTVTYTVSDECGNMSTFTATLTIEDGTAPDLTGCTPLDITVDCNVMTNSQMADQWNLDNIAALEICAADGCDTDLSGQVVSNYSFDNLTNGCGETGSILVMYTVTDDCGNSSMTSATFVIIDTIAPFVTFQPSDTTVDCDSDLGAVQAIMPLWDDDCSGFDITAISSISQSVDCPNAFLISRSWTATDSCGNSATVSQTIMVQDTVGPDLSQCPELDQTVECTGLSQQEIADQWNAANISSLTSCATDNCTVDFEGLVTSNYSYENFAEGCGLTGTITVTYFVNDGCDNITTATGVFIIEDTTPPDLTGCPSLDLTVECGPQNEAEASAWNAANILSIEGCVADLCDDGFAGQVTSNYSFVNLSDGCGASGSLVVTYTITDDCNNTSTYTAIFTIEDNTAPNLTACASLDITIECGFENEAEASAWDAANIAALEGCATDLCDGSFAGQVTSDFDFDNLIIACGLSGMLDVTYTVTDDCGNASTFVATITTEDNTPPDLSGCASLDVTFECDIATNAAMAMAWNLANIVSLEDCTMDNCDTDFTSQVTSNFNFNNLSNGCGGTGTLVVTYTVTDDCGNSTTFAATLTIEDTTSPEISFTDPLLAGIPNGGTVEFQCFGQDPNWELPTLDETAVDAVDACSALIQLSFNEQFIADGDCAIDGFIQRFLWTWIATDECGNTSSATVFFDLVDHLPPTLDGVPANITVSCDAIPEPPLVIATDECMCACVVDYSESMLAGCVDGQTLIRTWTAEDQCGNVTVETQEIFLIDNMGPQIAVNLPGFNDLVHGSIIEFDCNNGGVPGMFFELGLNSANIQDACSNPVESNYQRGHIKANNCEFSGFIEQWVHSWTAVDACGNKSVFDLFVRLTDHTPPALHNVSDYVCGDEPPLGQVYAEDACSPSSSFYWWDIEIESPCGDGSAIRRVYEAWDNCGNRVRDTSVIIRNDDISPEMLFVHPDLTGLSDGDSIVLSCSGIGDGGYSGFDTDAVEVKDDCNAGLEVLFTEELIQQQQNCILTGVLGVVELKWTATDICGNTVQLTLYQKLIDTSEPEFVDFQGELTVECGDEIPEFTVIDDCGEVELSFIEFEQSGGCPNNYDLIRVYTAKDACGNTNVELQEIHFVDTEGPVIEGVDPEVCDDLSIPEVVGFDQCSGEKVDVLLILQDTLDVPCKDGMVITRTWRAADDCGNITELLQYIVLDDDTPPLLQIANPFIPKWLGNEDNLILLSQENLYQALNELNYAHILATDECDQDIFAVLQVDTLHAENCAEEGWFEQRSYTWTATDACGNSASLGFTVRIMDDLVPVFLEQPGDTMIICGEVPSPVTPAVFDHSLPVTIEFDEVTLPAEGFEDFLIIRTWIATDGCGNQSKIEQTIYWTPSTEISCSINVPAEVDCNTHGVEVSVDVEGGLEPLTYTWEVIDGHCFIQSGQGTPEISIYVGFTEITLQLTVEDQYGCSNTCELTFGCENNAGGDLTDMGTLNGSPAQGVESTVSNAADAGLNQLSVLQLYPNPTMGNLQLYYHSGVEGLIDAIVYDALGQKVWSGQLNALKGLNQQNLDFNHLRDGAYILKLNNSVMGGAKTFIISR